MGLSLGTYDFDPDRTWFTINRRAVIGQTGRRNFVHHQWQINGSVAAANSTALAVKVAALEEACVDGVDLVFSLCGHQLLSADTTQGTHVRMFRWIPGYDGVRGSGAECVLRRTFQMIVDGLVPQTADTDIVAWRETIMGMGTGGADIKPVGSLSGGVQAQTVQDFTPYFAIQSGYAIGLTGYPAVATPLWTPNGNGGVYWIPSKFRTGFTSPDYGLNTNTHFKTEWSYAFWSASVLAGTPAGF